MMLHSKMKRIAVSIAVLAASVGWLAGSAQPAQQELGASRCVKVSSGLLSNLRSGLKAKARGKLSSPRGVKSRAQITSGPRGFAAGTYFVSAQVRGFGIATWAADAKAFRTGGGFITVVGPVARRVSILGVDLPPSSLQAWGLSENTDGYAASRRCVA